MKLRGIQWVFFDVGYTLINEDEAAWDRVLQIQQGLARRGVVVTSEQVKGAVERAASDQARSPVSRAIARLSGSKELSSRLRAEFPWRKDLEKPYPDAIRVVSGLSESYKLGIIANQSPGTETRLEKWGLLRFMSLVVASAEVGLAKPDPAIFEFAIERAGSTPEKTVMIGDRIDNDIAPANWLGWKTVRVKQGLSAGQVPIDQTQAPDFEVNQLDEVLEVL